MRRLRSKPCALAVVLCKGLGVLFVAAALAAVVAGAAHGTFRGTNGSIATGFRAAGSADHDVYRVDPNGSSVDLTPSTPNSIDFQPSWSPDGKRIAFSSDRGGGAFAIYLMKADGSAVTPVPNTVGGHQPSWSPDGKRLVFMDAPAGYIQLFVVNLDGTGLRQLTNTPAPSNNYNPHFSPTGTKIVFSSDRTQDYSCGFGSAACISIYTMKADGSNPVKLTDESLDGAWPDWSPSGNDIVFTSHWNDPNSNIFVIHADGSQLRQVTHTQGDDALARWSPDGTRLVYTNADGFPLELFAINADGSGVPTQLTHLNGIASEADWGSGGS